MSTINVLLPSKMKSQLDRLAKKESQNRSELVRDAIRQYIWRKDFHTVRDMMVPHAKKMGIHSDEDVFKLLS